MKTHLSRSFSFDSPAIYQICVEGQVDPKYSDRLDGMAINLESSKEGSPMSFLVGRLPDQAALNGVLCTLYEWHLPVLTVKRISEGREDLGLEGEAVDIPVSKEVLKTDQEKGGGEN